MGLVLIEGGRGEGKLRRKRERESTQRDREVCSVTAAKRGEKTEREREGYVRWSKG